MKFPKEPEFPRDIFGWWCCTDVGRPLELEINIGDVRWDAGKLGDDEYLTFKDSKAATKKLIYDYVTNKDFHQATKYFIYKIIKTFTPEELDNYKEFVLYDEPVYGENREYAIQCNRKVDIFHRFKDGADCYYGYLLLRIPRYYQPERDLYEEAIHDYNVVCGPNATGFTEEYVKDYKRKYIDHYYSLGDSLYFERALETELLINNCKCDDKACIHIYKRRLAKTREREDIIKQLKVELKKYKY